MSMKSSFGIVADRSGLLRTRLSRVLTGTGDARIDRLCHLRRDVMRELGQLLGLRGQSIELDARVGPRIFYHVRDRLCGGQVLGKIEGGDDIAVRHLHKPSPIVHYALGRSRLVLTSTVIISFTADSICS